MEYIPGISTNEIIPWSLDLIEHFLPYLEFNALAKNKGVWEKAFKPFVNDEIIETVLRIIN